MLIFSTVTRGGEENRMTHRLPPVIQICWIDDSPEEGELVSFILRSSIFSAQHVQIRQLHENSLLLDVHKGAFFLPSRKCMPARLPNR